MMSNDIYYHDVDVIVLDIYGSDLYNLYYIVFCFYVLFILNFKRSTSHSAFFAKNRVSGKY